MRVSRAVAVLSVFTVMIAAACVPPQDPEPPTSTTTTSTVPTGPRTVRVSVASDGTEGSRASNNPSVSADGRYVSFMSSSALVPGDTNGVDDVFVHDRVTRTTTRVSVASGGAQSASPSDGRPAISGDGRYVAFDSPAQDLDPDDNNGWSTDVFVHDRDSGTTELVSIGHDGQPADSYSNSPDINGDGTKITFTSHATNLVPGDTNNWGDVFVADRSTGTIERVSVATGGAQSDGPSSQSAVSDDGGHVVFQSSSALLAEPLEFSGGSDVYVRDLTTGVTTRVSEAFGGGAPDWVSERPTVSTDGRFVAFVSRATNLTPTPGVLMREAYVRDMATGITSLVSATPEGTSLDEPSLWSVISADGRWVAFETVSGNVVPGDTNARADIFLFDRAG